MISLNVLSSPKDIDLTPGQSYSFINPASIDATYSNPSYLKTTKFMIDGGLLVLFFRIFLSAPVKRASFDFTSLAHYIFQYAKDDDKTIFFVGGSAEEIEKFCNKIEVMYGRKIIAGFSNGYEKDESLVGLYKRIVDSNSDFLVVGMGAGKQEEFLSSARQAGFEGVGFSCGGFIRQESLRLEGTYYPRWINLLKIRFFYRMVKEPHTIKRYFVNYPKNLVLLFYKIRAGVISIKLL